jgi:hypothetical protein
MYIDRHFMCLLAKQDHYESGTGIDLWKSLRWTIPWSMPLVNGFNTTYNFLTLKFIVNFGHKRTHLPNLNTQRIN